MLENQEMSNNSDIDGNFTLEPEVQIKEESDFLDVSINGVTIKKELEDSDEYNSEVEIEEFDCSKIKAEIKENFSDEVTTEDDSEVPNKSLELLEKINEENNSYVKKRWFSLISQNLRRNVSQSKRQEYNSSLTCSKCSLNFESETDLAAHEENHDDGLFQCSECDKVFDREFSLKIHRSFHQPQKRHKCEICEKTFTRKASLRDHTLSHSGKKPYQCDVCKKYYRSKLSLSSHFRYHFKEKKYVCPVCKKMFFQPSALSQHLAMHKAAKDYQCDLCKKHFAYRCTLKRHIKSHFGEEKYPCDECGKYFKQNSSLSFHKRTVHLGLRPFKCEDCDKTFARSYSLKVHMNIHRALQMQNTVQVINRKN